MRNNRLLITGFRLLLLTIICSLLVTSCCPQVSKQGTKTEKILIGIRQDTVKQVNLKPSIAITDESATFVATPSVETIDTVVSADGTLRKYKVKISRIAKSQKVISGDTTKLELVPEYDLLFAPVLPDSLFNQVTTDKTVLTKSRAWYELPLFIAVTLISLIIGLLIGRKLQ